MRTQIHVTMGAEILLLFQVYEQAGLAKCVETFRDCVCILKVAITQPTNQVCIHIFYFEAAWERV